MEPTAELVTAATSEAAPPSLDGQSTQPKAKPIVLIVLGMAGSGKTTFTEVSKLYF